MKITFLGTAPGYAEKDRFTTSTLIEVGEHSYLIDAGAPVETLMLTHGKDIMALREIFITHMHEDHVGCLSGIVKGCVEYRKNRKISVYFPEEQGKDGFIAWLRCMHANNPAYSEIGFFSFEEGVVFENDEIKVTAKRTTHLAHIGVPTYSFIVEAEGKRVFFSGDMSAEYSELLHNLGDEKYDLIVCELAHAGICDISDILRKCNTDRLIFNHYNMPKRTEGLDELAKELPYPARLAVQGEEVEV